MPVACGSGAGGSLTEQSRRKTVNNQNLVSIVDLGCCAWHVSFIPFEMEVLMRFWFLVTAGKGVWGDMSRGKKLLVLNCYRWLLLACSHVIRQMQYPTWVSARLVAGRDLATLK